MIYRHLKESFGKPLFPRERQAAALVADGGKTDKEVAAVMGLTVYSAHAYINRAMWKTGCTTRTELAVYIVKEEMRCQNGG